MLWALWGLESCLLLNSHGLKPGGHAEQSPVYTYWVNGQLSDVYPPLATNALLTMQKTTKKKGVWCFLESPNETLSILWGLVLDYISEVRRTSWRRIILEHNGERRGNKGGECFPYFSQEDPILSGIFVCKVGDVVDHISSSWIFTYSSQCNSHIYHAVMISVKTWAIYLVKSTIFKMNSFVFYDLWRN